VKNPLKVMREKYIITSFIILVSSLSIWAQSKPTTLPTDKQFIIQAASNYGHDSSGFWDVQSKTSFFKKTINIQLWNHEELRNQKYIMRSCAETGYYEISPANDESLCISVDTISSNDFQPIRLMARNSKPNQRFIFHHIGDGRFKITDKYGKTFGLSDCSGKNGTAVLVSKSNQNYCSDWYLIDIVSKKAFIPIDDNTRGFSSTIYIENKKIMKLIVNGKENEIKEYFKNILAEDLLKTDNGTIVKAFSKLNANDKITHTIWILEEVKNRQVDIREYVYTELGKVDFNKPTIVLRHLINNYFTNYSEKEAALAEKVSALQHKMNR